MAIDQVEMPRARREVLREIHQYIERYGYSPTVRELQSVCGYTSTSPVWLHLRTLRQDGLVTFVPHTNRTIRITEKGYEYISTSEGS